MRPIAWVSEDMIGGRRKLDLPENTAMPRIEVDPNIYSVRVDGERARDRVADGAADLLF